MLEWMFLACLLRYALFPLLGNLCNCRLRRLCYESANSHGFNAPADGCDPLL
ncbi:hypothetical protein KC19_4G211800 [Ceratodon purpureus]|uniref:Uncharacterized protein n=1 Tax=Ceratodon purpureus TaxID=3225 RepID=A0A8T0IDG6_CERPU|nr:hypothetical protein KC19_4G211800 [Ceratodon purpureus]